MSAPDATAPSDAPPLMPPVAPSAGETKQRRVEGSNDMMYQLFKDQRTCNASNWSFTSDVLHKELKEMQREGLIDKKGPPPRSSVFR